MSIVGGMQDLYHELWFCVLGVMESYWGIGMEEAVWVCSLCVGFHGASVQLEI